jgi:hypothetical protein
MLGAALSWFIGTPLFARRINLVSKAAGLNYSCDGYTIRLYIILTFLLRCVYRSVITLYCHEDTHRSSPGYA